MFPRRHVGFGQTVPIRLGQARAVVLDRDRGGACLLDHLQRDLPRRQRIDATEVAPIDRVDRVLQQVRQGPADLLAVAGDHDRVIGPFEDEIDRGVRVALQEYRLIDQRDQVLFLHHRLGQAREGREFIDHSTDVADVANDRVGANLEGLRVVFDLGQILAL